MRYAGHMSTVCSWCAIMSRPAYAEYYKFVCESAARATDFIRTSTHTSTGCKEDARWSFGRRSTSIRPTAAGHTGAHMKLHIQARHTFIQRVRSHSRERSSGGAVRAARPRSGGAPAAERRAIATRTPLRHAPLGPSAAPHHTQHHRRSRRGNRRRRRRPPRPAARRRASSRRCRSKWAPKGPPGAPSGTRNNPPRQQTMGRPPWEGSQQTSPEPPASSLASSDGGARGCGVELGVEGAFLPCASAVRSTRVDRERLAEARAGGCEGAKAAGDARAGAKDGRWGGAPHWRDRLMTTDEEDVQQSRPGRRN